MIKKHDKRELRLITEKLLSIKMGILTSYLGDFLDLLLMHRHFVSLKFLSKYFLYV